MHRPFKLSPLLRSDQERPLRPARLSRISTKRRCMIQYCRIHNVSATPFSQTCVVMSSASASHSISISSRGCIRSRRQHHVKHTHTREQIASTRPMLIQTYQSCKQRDLAEHPIRRLQTPTEAKFLQHQPASNNEWESLHARK